MGVNGEFFTIITTPWTTGKRSMKLISEMSSITVKVDSPFRILLKYLSKSYPILRIWDQNPTYLQDRRSNTWWRQLIATIKSCIWVRWCWQNTNREWPGNLKGLSTSWTMHCQIERHPTKFGHSIIVMTNQIPRQTKMSLREDPSPETHHWHLFSSY